jgi:hypothetical protein
MEERWRGVAIAALSGGLSYAACFVGDGLGTRWGAGLVFGALVLAPSFSGVRQRVLLGIESVLVYRAAVSLATRLYVEASWSGAAGCALAGALGALALSLAAGATLRTRPGPGRTALATLVGSVGGVLIGLRVDASDDAALPQLLLLSGFVVWQVGYAAAHGLRPAWGSRGASAPIAASGGGEGAW